MYAYACTRPGIPSSRKEGTFRDDVLAETLARTSGLSNTATTTPTLRKDTGITASKACNSESRSQGKSNDGYEVGDEDGYGNGDVDGDRDRVESDWESESEDDEDVKKPNGDIGSSR